MENYYNPYAQGGVGAPQLPPDTCRVCGAPLDANNRFCRMCGSRTDAVIFEQRRGEGEKPVKKKKAGKVVAITLVSLVLVVSLMGGGLLLLSRMQANQVKESITSGDFDDALDVLSSNAANPLFVYLAKKEVPEIFREYIADGEAEKAAEMYNELLAKADEIPGDDLVNEAIAAVDKCEADYAAADISFEDAQQTLEGYEQFKKNSVSERAVTAGENITKLKASRDNFANAERLYSSGDYLGALEAYALVVKADSDYSNAQNRIRDIVTVHKADIYYSVDVLAAANDYEGALGKLNTFSNYCSDTDVATKITEIEEKKRDYEGAVAMGQQQVFVSSLRVFNENTDATNRVVSVIFQNNSTKVVKDIYVGIYSYDSNGYPLEITNSTYSGGYTGLMNGKATNCNLLPGRTYGEDKYYSGFSGRMTQAHACVRKVEFTDGTIWENPYYEYWMEDYSERY